MEKLDMNCRRNIFVMLNSNAKRRMMEGFENFLDYFRN